MADPAQVIGSTLDGRYLVHQLIGQGGMGVVYVGDHIGLGRKVAIKFLLDKYAGDAEVIARFHQEARTASRIGSDHIVDVLDVGQTPDGRSYMVMEHLQGADLAEVLTHTGAMDAERSVHIIGQVLQGLAAAHQEGIVHRDMKPENVFLTVGKDGRDFVKIMDFGISKLIDAHDSQVKLTKTGVVVGTPIYMAPEQARAEQTVDHRVDIYAVGVMFYELLAGQPPFMADAYLQLVTQHLFDPPPSLSHFRPELPPIFEQVTMRALAKAPEERWQSATDFAAALPGPRELGGAAWDSMSTIGGSAAMSAAMSAATPAVAPALTATPGRPPKRRSMAPVMIIIGAVLAAAGMIALTMFLVRGKAEQSPVARSSESSEAARAAKAATPEPVATAPTAPSVTTLESTLEIDSQPRGAKIFLDDELQGVTPLTMDHLVPGVHAVRIEKQGFQTVETSRTLEAGITRSFVVELDRKGSRTAGKVTRVKTRPRGSSPASVPAQTKPAQTKPAQTKPAQTKPATRPSTKPNPYLNKKPNPYD